MPYLDAVRNEGVKGHRTCSENLEGPSLSPIPANLAVRLAVQDGPPTPFKSM
jgi:hypothetical protein